jgi:hypothetical protein
VKVERQFRHHLLEVSVVSLQRVYLLAGGISDCISTKTLLASLHELLRPGIKTVGLDTFSTAQLVDCHLSAKAFEHYADLLF